LLSDWLTGVDLYFPVNSSQTSWEFGGVWFGGEGGLFMMCHAGAAMAMAWTVFGTGAINIWIRWAGHS